MNRRGRQILHDVTCEATYGAITSVLGPNGAGKTTLLKSMVGLLPYAGAIEIAGVELSLLAHRERARRLGYVPQRSALDAPLRVTTVVGHGLYAHATASPGDERRAIDRAMAATDTAELAERSYLDLSEGEQRRVLVARALATGARILLLDEPTASLDIGHALALFRLLRRLAKDGMCVIIVLHDLNDALSFTDRAVLLDRGHVAAQGATDQVIAQEPIRSVYGLELSVAPRLHFTLPEP
ncbi:MAG TPA: ABC transporter ATP-binding protein [Kofleriaceae bacterium]|nr:ABC transporter ATP-binding protein [Kofleriaceae bacterium]